MKILKPSFSAIVFMVLAVGCRKNDFSSELEQEATVTAAASPLPMSTSEADSTGWNYSADWKVAAQEDFSVYYININEKAITEDVVENGLVLIYKKNEISLTALPVEEGANEQTQYWYHQVTEGNIMISVDAYGATSAPDASTSFKYFIVTPEKIEALEAQGYSAEKLMELTFEEASQLL